MRENSVTGHERDLFPILAVKSKALADLSSEVEIVVDLAANAAVNAAASAVIVAIVAIAATKRPLITRLV